jgi:peptide/nickel transport system substrate-binding protein
MVERRGFDLGEEWDMMGETDPGFERFLEEWSRRDFLKTMSVGTAYAFFLAGGAAALEACGNPGSQGQTSATPQRGGTLIEGWSTEPSYLLPVRSSDVYSNVANRLLFEGLLTVDDRGNLQPNFAQKMPDVSSDGLTYTFKLRSDIKWSDGSPLTPEDVVFTYELYYDPKYDGLLGNSRPNAKRYIKSATAQGDSIILQATTVFAPFLLQFGVLPIVPKKVLSGKTGVQLNTDDFNAAPPISNGKFKFQSWTKGDKLILARNDLYFRGRPNLDTWVYKKVPDAVAVLQQLKTGEIDVGRLDPSSYDEATAQPNLNVLSFPTFGFDEYIYQLDPGKPGGQLFQDKSVRQALAYGLDRKALVQAAYFGQAIIADSILPNTSWAYSKDVKPKYAYDAKKAGDLLDAAGWKMGATGIREKAGQKLSFEMVTNADNSTRVKNLQIMQEQWKKIGVDAQIRNIANLGLLSDQLTSARQFALMFIGYSLSPFGEPDQSSLWHSRTTAVGGNNGGLFKNAQVDKLLDDGVATLDRNKRKDIYFQLQNIMAEELPSDIICYPKGIYGVNKRVHGYNLGTFWLYGFGNPLFMKDVWVEPKK